MRLREVSEVWRVQALAAGGARSFAIDLQTGVSDR